jgi:hypothetical protein
MTSRPKSKSLVNLVRLSVEARSKTLAPKADQGEEKAPATAGRKNHGNRISPDNTIVHVDIAPDAHRRMVRLSSPTMTSLSTATAGTRTEQLPRKPLTIITKKMQHQASGMFLHRLSSLFFSSAV